MRSGSSPPSTISLSTFASEAFTLPPSSSTEGLTTLDVFVDAIAEIREQYSRSKVFAYGNQSYRYGCWMESGPGIEDSLCLSRGEKEAGGVDRGGGKGKDGASRKRRGRKGRGGDRGRDNGDGSFQTTSSPSLSQRQSSKESSSVSNASTPMRLPTAGKGTEDNKLAEKEKRGQIEVVSTEEMGCEDREDESQLRETEKITDKYPAEREGDEGEGNKPELLEVISKVIDEVGKSMHLAESGDEEEEDEEEDSENDDGMPVATQEKSVTVRDKEKIGSDELAMSRENALRNEERVRLRSLNDVNEGHSAAMERELQRKRLARNTVAITTDELRRLSSIPENRISAIEEHYGKRYRGHHLAYDM